jgi:O-antigen/teichoic acid export membrane protein
MFSTFNSSLSATLLLQTVIKIAASSLGLISQRWLVSETSKQDFADYSTALAYVLIILLIIDFGISRLILKVYTNSRDEFYRASFWSTTQLLRGISFFVGLGLIACTIHVINIQDTFLVYSLYAIQFIILWDQNFRALCDAKGQTWKFITTDFLSKIIFIGLLFAYPLFSLPFSALWYLIIAYAGTIVLAWLIDAVWYKQWYSWSWPDWSLFKPYWRAIAYITLASLGTSSLHYGRILFVRLFDFSIETQGALANADKILILAMIIPNMTIPMLASRAKQKTHTQTTTSLGLWLGNHAQKIDVVLLEWLIYMLGFGIVMSAGMYLVGPSIVHIIDTGNKFPLAVEFLQTFSLVMMVFPMLKFMSDYLFLQKNGEKIELYNTIISSSIGFGLYFVGIIQYGIWGFIYAVVGYHLIDVIIKIISIVLIQRSIDHHKYNEDIA